MALRPQHVTQELLNKVTKALGITALDQWYYVSLKAAKRAIGKQALDTFGGTLSGFLKYAYPQHKFDEEKLTPKIRLEKDQKFLEVIIRQLFPNVEIQTKARKAVGIMNPETGMYLEIDFWIPSLKLGIEYQDRHHFGYQWYAHDTLENYQKRDDIKKSTMSSMGYTLITIGCWWDKTLESVVATIRKFRPDLLQEHDVGAAKPIPLAPPPGFFSDTPVIPGVVGLMNPFIPGHDFNPTNWYAGEKNDGIRGVYNPDLRKMFSRAGKELSILPSLLNDIPNMLIEGEIVAGRGNYAKTSTVAHHTQHEKVNWPLFRYVIFDIPDYTFTDYTQRYSTISNTLTVQPRVFSQIAFRVLLINKGHLKMLLDTIISDSGEGVIAQQDTRYEYGRGGLAKIKVRRDADAQVLSVNDSICTCKLVSGVITDIHFCDDFDQSKLNEGDIVSFYYDGYSRNCVPIRGEIYKVRYDIAWEQLMRDDYAQNIAVRRLVKDTMGSRSLIASKKEKHRMGYWNKVANVRAFFDDFAHTNEFDPLVPENWYPVRFSSLQNSGGGGLLKAYAYNIKKALSCAYPEVKFKRENFVTYNKPRGHWHKTPNIRAFFDEFAQTSGFDPLVVENWYPVKTKAIKQAGGSGLLGVNHIKQALSSAYPELRFDKENFRSPVIKGYWSDPSNVRAFFDEFAKTSRFDPLVPGNWNVIRNSTLQIASGSGLLKTYNYNLKEALMCAYPELTLQSTGI